MAMIGAELTAEYRAALSATPTQDMAPLLAAGVRAAIVAMLQPATCRITVDCDTYRPDQEGGDAFILPLRADNPVGPEAADPEATIRAGAIVDLLAIHPSHPARWALRLGNATWLGAIEPQYLHPPPVSVWRTPLAWMLAGCRGLVLLSSDRAEGHRILTECIGGILAEDGSHAAELHAILDRPRPAPPVIVRARHAA